MDSYGLWISCNKWMIRMDDFHNALAKDKIREEFSRWIKIIIEFILIFCIIFGIVGYINVISHIAIEDTVGLLQASMLPFLVVILMMYGPLPGLSSDNDG